MIVNQLEHIHDGKGQFGRADIPLVSVTDRFAADATVELVVLDVGRTHSDGRLEVPVARQYPLVAVAHASAHGLTFEAGEMLNKRNVVRQTRKKLRQTKEK